MESHGVKGEVRPDAHWQEIRVAHLRHDQFCRCPDRSCPRAPVIVGIPDNTIVGFISDHGDMMGDHWMVYKGSYPFEGCVRIPWLMSLPGGARGLTYQGLVSQIDVMPTILDLCQVPSPNRARLEMPQAHERSAQVSPIRPWPGVSLSPVLRGDSRALRSAVVIHNDDPGLGLKMRTIVDDCLKLTHYPGQAFGELFDLQEDPGELHNLWACPEWQQARTDLLLKLLHEDTLTQPWLPMPYSVA